MRKRLFALFCLLLCTAVLLPAAAGALELDRTQLPGYYVPLGTSDYDLNQMAKEAGWFLNPTNSKGGFYCAVHYPSNQTRFRLNGLDDWYGIYVRPPKKGQTRVVVGCVYQHVCATEAEAKAECSAMLRSLKQIHGAPPSKTAACSPRGMASGA